MCSVPICYPAVLETCLAARPRLKHLGSLSNSLGQAVNGG